MTDVYRSSLLAALALLLVACGREGPPAPEGVTQGEETPTPGEEGDGDADNDDDVDPPDGDDPQEEDGPVVPETAGLPSDWHHPPGDLLPGSNSERGSTGIQNVDVIATSMLFPLETGPGFANSQIFLPGGSGYQGGAWPGPGGSESSEENFDYRWRDNFCEVRLDPNKHVNPICPGGLAHTGQDFRGPTCENAVHWLVAPEDGHISWVGSISINIMGAESGYKYEFHHVQKPYPDWVVLGAPVTKGQRIARMSDRLSSTSRETTVHLHLELHGSALIDGASYTGALPPYTSLVEAYLDYADANPDKIDPVPTVPNAQCTTPQWP